MGNVLSSHVREGDYRRPALLAGFLHLLIFFAFTFGVSLLPRPAPLEIGLGGGGGGGEFVSVGLAADTGGGEGMYKPPVTPRAETAPVEEQPEETVVEPVPEEDVFSQTAEENVAEEEEPVRRPSTTEEQEEASPGQIAREPDPGRGTRGGGGAGEGVLGPGSGGLSLGTGSGQGQIESWYIRRVEQRVGRNWLQTSLGTLQRVQAVATFIVSPNGRISDVELEKPSGVSSVDLAVRRAILASDPLPPLPYELRDRTVLFRAVFEYPPR